METYENNKTTCLQELNGSDFEIADHQSDIIGWDIVDGLGEELGEVKDLIFDSNARKVRYIVADLDLHTTETPDVEDNSRLVLIPIGIVDLDKDEVIVPNVSGVSLATLPRFEPGNTVSPAEELAIRYAFLGQDALPNADVVVYEQHPENFYDHDHFDESRFTKRLTGPSDQINI